MTNRLYYGDNLQVLRDHIADESVDLIYLDPPFNSNAGYNVLFKAASGAGADASIEAFDDTWTWGDSAKEALMDIASGTNRPLSVMIEAMRTAIGENPLMAYQLLRASSRRMFAHHHFRHWSHGVWHSIHQIFDELDATPCRRHLV